MCSLGGETCKLNMCYFGNLFKNFIFTYLNSSIAAGIRKIKIFSIFTGDNCLKLIRFLNLDYPFGPKNLSHSAAMSSHFHSNKWTMVVRPETKLLLHCAAAWSTDKAVTSSNNAAYFILQTTLDTKTTHRASVHLYDALIEEETYLKERYISGSNLQYKLLFTMLYTFQLIPVIVCWSFRSPLLSVTFGIK